MSRSIRDSGESIFLTVIFALLFLALALLAAFLIAGESRRARILVEYEADRIASGLVDAFRSQGDVASATLDSALIDPRILGFGIYRPNGNLAVGFGDAPRFLEQEGAAPAFRYDEARQSLSLARPLGMGALGRPEAPGMMRMWRRARTPGSGPGPVPGGLFYLSMGIDSYYRSRVLYKTATYLVPFLIAGLAAAFLSLLLSNLRYRRRAAEQETLARLGESARTLAHEIRNPLGAIRIQTGLIRKRMGSDAGRELDAIDEETERLNALTRRVGDFLRNPRGEPEAIELGDFLRDLVGRSPFPLLLPAALPAATVLFDRELLRSVVENLARNAHESYGDSGGVVELALSREGGRLVLSLLDHGPGIPDESMGKVFDPFYTSKTQGSGIGLPLARRFVEAAGGALTLSGRPGGGTEARVVLPLGGAR